MFVDVPVILFHALMERSCTIIPGHDNPTYRSISATSATPAWLMCLRILLSYLPHTIVGAEYSTLTRNDSQTIKNSGALFENVGAALLLQQHFSSYSHILTIKPLSGVWRNNNNLVWGMQGFLESQPTLSHSGPRCWRRGRRGEFNHAYKLPSGVKSRNKKGVWNSSLS